VVHVEVRGDTLVGDCGVGLTRIAEVVMEMQMQGEEISHGALSIILLRNIPIFLASKAGTGKLKSKVPGPSQN